VRVAPDELAGSEDVVSRGPSVAVERHGVAGLDARVEHAHRLVLKQEPVVPGAAARASRWGAAVWAWGIIARRWRVGAGVPQTPLLWYAAGMMMQGAFPLQMILYYAVYVLLGIVCIGAIARALWSPLEVFRGPACGGCGHGVRDMLQGVCPECGGQYAKVGITTPGMAVRLRGSLPIALLAWATLMVTAASFTHGWLEQRAWARYSVAASSFSTGVGGSSGPQQESYSTELTPVTRTFSSGGRFDQAERGDDQTYRISLALNYVTDADKVQSGTCVFKLRRNGEPESFRSRSTWPTGASRLRTIRGRRSLRVVRTPRWTRPRWRRGSRPPASTPRVQR
jgi:hypothetical protein